MKLILYLLTVMSLNLFAAHEALKAWTEVISAIHLCKFKDLDFGEALQGDPAMNISPQQGAEFSVTGEPYRAYQILIPDQVTLRTASGSGPNEQILVNQFRSYPEKAGRLDCDGKQTLRVGATRASLLQSQKAGAYIAPFVVTVMYQ